MSEQNTPTSRSLITSEHHALTANMGWNEFTPPYPSNSAFPLDRRSFYSGHKMDSFWHVLNVTNQGFLRYSQTTLTNNAVTSVKYTKYSNQSSADCLCSFFYQIRQCSGRSKPTRLCKPPLTYGKCNHIRQVVRTQNGRGRGLAFESPGQGILVQD